MLYDWPFLWSAWQSEEATAPFFWYAKFSNEIQSAVALRFAGALQFGYETNHYEIWRHVG